MRWRFALFACLLGCLGAPALAQEAQPAKDMGGDYGALAQIELTEDQVSRYLASIPDMQKSMGDLPADSAEPDAKTMAKFEAIAKAHGFRSFDEYNTVAGNISLVVDGVDPETKTYVGPEKLIQKAIDEVKADKKMSEADKTTAVTDLQAQMKAMAQVKYKGNIDLVLKYYDRLNSD